MRTIYVTILSIFFLVFGLHAQTTLVEENFDTYTAGDPLADQAGDPWTTWSDAPGGPEDPLVSDDYSMSAANSVNVTTGNDAVLKLGDKTEGRYKVSFYIYIPSGNIAYYNLLSVFAGANSEWGMQVFFDTGGFGHIDAGIGDAATFNYNYDEWIKVDNYVDIDNDWGEVFVNDGEYLVGWQWTTGTFGDEVPLQLGAMNIYAWDETGTPNYYLDDVLYEEMPLGEAPANLTADVDGATVSLSWDAPENDTPESYYIFRNGELLGEATTNMFDDEIEFPGTYTYYVKAYYDPNGLSMATNEIDVEVEGGTDRDQVVLEIATGTWCFYCPGSSWGADDLVEGGYDVAVIEFHIGDDYQNDYAVSRDSYYGVAGYPTAYFDGILSFVGGSNTESMFDEYLPLYENRIDDPSLFDMEMEAEVDARGYTFDVTLNAEQLWTYDTDNTVMHLALTESHIPEFWYTLEEVNFVLREMYPDENGTAISMEEIGDTQEMDMTIEVPEDYEIDNCELVAFIQDNDTKEVLNASKVNLGQVVGIAELGDRYSRIYPNPASEQVTIESASKLKNISIYSLNGQKVYEIAMDQQNINLNVDFLETGMYLIRLETEAGTKIEKLSIR